MDVFNQHAAPDAVKSEKTVLIADDETDILNALQLLLLSEGYRVLACSNGRDAWSMIQEHTPDLVLTDIMMPYLSGLDLLNKVRSWDNTRNTPVILMSCIKPAQIQNRDERISYIPKPFVLDRLLTLIRGYIGTDQTLSLS